LERSTAVATLQVIEVETNQIGSMVNEATMRAFPCRHGNVVPFSGHHVALRRCSHQMLMPKRTSTTTATQPETAPVEGSAAPPEFGEAHADQNETDAAEDNSVPGTW
jgi:hypothetical protein